MENIRIKPVLDRKHIGGFPKHIKISGMKIPILSCEDIGVYHPENDKERLGTAKGAYNNEVGCILIEKGLKKQFMQETLLHECIHIIDYFNSLELSEEQVKFLSKDLYALLMDNPVLRRDLSE